MPDTASPTRHPSVREWVDAEEWQCDGALGLGWVDGSGLATVIEMCRS